VQVPQRVEDVEQLGVRLPFEVALSRPFQALLEQPEPLQRVDPVARRLERQERVALLEDQQRLPDDRQPLVRGEPAARLSCGGE